MIRVLVPLTGLLAGACYTYVPATIEAVPVGARVRGLLTTEAQVALEDTLGLELRTLSGTLVERDGERLVFTVRSTDDGVGRGSRALYQRVALAPGDVLRVEERQLHRARTWAFVGALAAGATALVVTQWGGNPGREPPPDGGGNELRVPIWFRVGLR